MNFHELYRKIEAIDKGKSLDEFLGFGKKKEQPAAPAPGQQPPGQSAQPAPGQQPPGQSAQPAADKIGGMAGNAVDAIKKRQQMLKDLEEGDKADKDYDGDGEVESDKDEVWGSRMKAAAKAGKMDEEVVDECGMMGDMGAMDAPKQQDSVTMNVSMNGSGAGGIRDLLNVLKDIQDGPSDSMSGDDMDMGPDMDSDTDAGPDVLLKKNIDSMASAIDDDFANSAPGDTGPEIMPAHDAGADLHKQKGAYPKASGGDNAMKLKDGATYKLPKGDIQIKLENLYQEIKKRNQLSEISKELRHRVERSRFNKVMSMSPNDPEYKKASDKFSKSNKAAMDRNFKKMVSDPEGTNRGFVKGAEDDYKRGWSTD